MYDLPFVPSGVMLQDFERFSSLGQNWLGESLLVQGPLSILQGLCERCVGLVSGDTNGKTSHM